jgi:phosphoadenosine phosphosulfate reductase
MRWCCEEMKEGHGRDSICIFGVRAAESFSRSKNWRQVTKFRTGEGFVVNPILYWSQDEVWQFIHINKIPYCSLYDEGFKRIGCVGCPMVGGKNRLQAFKRWPGFEKAWQNAFKKYFEQRKGVPNKYGEERYIERWQTWQEYWNFWLSDKPSRKEKEQMCLGLY